MLHSELTLRAFAKLNLYLGLLGKRDDGYHEILSLMINVGLADTLVFRETASGVAVKSDSRKVPSGPENLCWKAAEALKKHTDYTGGAEIDLAKAIPVGAGLGGGSSDAACTLVGLNRLWRLGLSEGELVELAAGIGSDVPFFLAGGTQIAEGRGERLTRVEGLVEAWFVLAAPHVEVSSGWAYSVAKIGLTRPGHVTRMRLLTTTLDATGVTGILQNDLEAGVMEMYPAVSELRAALLSHGALGSLMSGSGPSVFGIVRDRTSAVDIAAALSRPDLSVFVLRAVRRGWGDVDQRP